jgi:hypothetical protein
MSSARLPQRLKRTTQKRDERTCPAHRAWVRRHHCSVSNCLQLPIECAHVRIETDGGVGLKPSDMWTVSLCAQHHREQHDLGERSFELKYDLDLKALAEEFAARSPHWVRPQGRDGEQIGRNRRL